MENVKVGQMGMLIWRESDERATWCYCVAKNVFDDRIEFLKKGVTDTYVHVLSSEDDEINVIEKQKPTSVLVMLYKNGKPAVSKQTIFGKYTFDPKK